MFGVCFNPFNMYSFTLTTFDEIDKLKKFPYIRKLKTTSIIYQAKTNIKQ